MSNTQTADIPSDSDVKVASSSATWRFAKGKIVKGSERQGTIEIRDKIVGRLQRVGIHSGIVRDTQVPYQQVEADILTSEGLVYVKSSLTDDDGQVKSSIATNGLAWALTQVEPNELICIQAASGNPTPKGGIPTYVNVSRVDENKVAHPIYKEKRDKNAPTMSVLQQWEELEPKVRAHPAFAPRPARRDDDEEGNPGSHLSALIKECQDKGWPHPEQATEEWLSMAAKFLGIKAPKTLAGISDDQWGEIRLELAPRTEVPGPLKAVAAVAAEPDPFA